MTAPRRVFAVVGLALLSVGGAVALAAIGFHLYLAELPTPPVTSEPAEVTAPSTDRLVVFLIDSLREDAAFDPVAMPHFNALADAGASGIAITPPMTLTTMAVVNFGTGLTPGISWSLRNFDAEPPEDEHVFALLAEAGRTVAFVGDASWTQLYGAYAPTTFSVRDEGFYQGAGLDIAETDRLVLHAAEDALGDPANEVVIIHVVGTDKVAHRSGAFVWEPDGPLTEYGRAVHAMDAELGHLYARYGAGGTWLVLTDHGCTLAGTHGGGEEEARRAAFAFVGEGIRPGGDHEMAFTSHAATLAALWGLRPPRTAETHAAWSLLELSQPATAALTNAHLAVRRAYVDGMARTLGEDVPEAAAVPLEASNTLLALLRAGDRRGLGIWGFALGFAALGLLFWGLARLAGQRRPVFDVLAALAVASLLVATERWRFPLIEVLGGWTRSGVASAALRLGVLALILGAVALLWRRSRSWTSEARTRAALLLWLSITAALAITIMTWPYGPLPEVYRSTVFVLVLALVATQGGVRRRSALAALAATAGLYVVATLVVDRGDHTVLSEGSIVSAIATLVVLSTVGGLAIRRRRSGRALAPSVWATVGGLAAIAAWTAAAGGAGGTRAALALAVVAIVAIAWRAHDPGERRDAAIAWGLGLALLLASPSHVLLVAAGALVAWWAARAWPTGSAGALLAATFVLALELSLFREQGYRFSFSALDVRVVFAATAEGIHLGQGLLLLLLQHLPPWIVLLAPFACRFAGRSTSVFAAAVVAIALVDAWVVFATFGTHIHDHWYTMHAVPLAVFGVCNGVLAAMALGLSAPTNRSAATAGTLRAEHGLAR